MDKSERWRVSVEVTRDGDAYSASSEQLPGVYGEGDTEEEAVESFWRFVDFMRDEMAVPEWPHSREGWSEVFPELAGLDDDLPDELGPEDWTEENEAGGSRLRIEDATDDYSVLAALMRNEFTSIVEQHEGWFIASCPEVPGSNGQGRTREECLANLAEAIELIMDG